MLPMFAIASALVLSRGKHRGWGLILFALIAAVHPATFTVALLAIGIVISMR